MTLLRTLETHAAAWLRDTSGALYAWFGLSFLVLAGSAAIGIDAAMLYAKEAQLQGAADAAAMAGATQLPDGDAARSMALTYAAKNLPVENDGEILVDTDVSVGNWDSQARTFTADVTPLNAIRVVTRRSTANGNAMPLMFARVFGQDEADLSAVAIAGGELGRFCLIALDETAQSALDVGEGEVVAHGCSVMVNSDDSEALDGQSGGALTAERICVAGSYSVSPSYAPTPESCNPISDPLETLASPTVPSTCNHTDLVITDEDRSLDSGRYCGGLQILGDSEVDLKPGLYIFDNGDFRLSGSSVVTGSGVTLYFTGDHARVDIATSGAVSLSAPIDGDHAGILFFQDRDAAAGQDHLFTGNAQSQFEGTAYLPVGDIVFSGSTDTAVRANYTVFVAQTIRFEGPGNLHVYSDYSSSYVPLPPGLAGNKIGLYY